MFRRELFSDLTLPAVKRSLGISSDATLIGLPASSTSCMFEQTFQDFQHTISNNYKLYGLLKQYLPEQCFCLPDQWTRLQLQLKIQPICWHWSFLEWWLTQRVTKILNHWMRTCKNAMELHIVNKTHDIIIFTMTDNCQRSKCQTEWRFGEMLAPSSRQLFNELLKMVSQYRMDTKKLQWTIDHYILLHISSN